MQNVYNPGFAKKGPAGNYPGGIDPKSNVESDGKPSWMSQVKPKYPVPNDYADYGSGAPSNWNPDPKSNLESFGKPAYLSQVQPKYGYAQPQPQPVPKRTGGAIDPKSNVESDDKPDYMSQIQPKYAYQNPHQLGDLHGQLYGTRAPGGSAPDPKSNEESYGKADYLAPVQAKYAKTGQDRPVRFNQGGTYGGFQEDVQRGTESVPNYQIAKANAQSSAGAYNQGFSYQNQGPVSSNVQPPQNKNDDGIEPGVAKIQTTEKFVTENGVRKKIIKITKIMENGDTKTEIRKENV